MRRNYILTFLFIMPGVLLLSRCGNYSFTGASIPPEAETVTISYFENKAPLVNPGLSQMLTNELKDRFQSQTSLRLEDYGGDLNFQGEIVDYSVRPVAIQGDDRAAMNRLTISVNVTFQNRLDEAMNYQTTFSKYEEYGSDQSLGSVEDQLTQQIVEYLVEDIYNKAVVNW